MAMTDGGFAGLVHTAACSGPFLVGSDGPGSETSESRSGDLHNCSWSVESSDTIEEPDSY